MTIHRFYGWKLTAVLWVLFLINTAFPLYGAGVVNSYMATDLHMDRKTLGLAFTLYTLCSGLSAPLVAIFVNRFGTRFTLTLGGMILALGSLTMAFLVRTELQAVLIFGIFVGCGSGFGGPLAIQTAVTHWFTKKRALALAIVMTGTGAGGLISAPLLNKVIVTTNNNWRTGWLLIAALAIGSTLMAAFFVRNRPSDLGQVPDGMLAPQDSGTSQGGKAHGKTHVYKAEIDWTFREAVRSHTLWLILIGGLIFCASFYMFLAHDVLYLKALGYSSSAAAMSLGVLTFSTVIGKVIFGIFGDRFEPRYIWSFAMLSFTAGILLAIKATNTVDIYIYAILIGSGLGASYISMMTMLSNYFGTTAYASIIGIALPVTIVGSSAAPFLSGLLYDHYGSYTTGFYFAAGLCLAGALLALLAVPPKLATSCPGDKNPGELQLEAIVEQ
ncbi:MAG: MFS transporter [Desulfuromonadaceae bacterium]